MQEKNFISIVLYIHNIEVDNIKSFCDKLNGGLLSHFKNYEIILVNDSAEEENLNKLVVKLNSITEHNTISIISFPEYVGLETAMMAGDDLAIGDYIFEFDNINIEFEQDILMRVYSKTQEGYDIVSACSDKKENSLFSKLFYKVYNRGVSKEKKLESETMRLLSRRAYNRVKSMARVGVYRKALYGSSGLKYFHIYDANIVTLNKHDKNEVKQRWQLALNSLMLFTNVVQRIAVAISCVFLLAVIIITIYIVSVFVLGKPVAGWTPIMMYLSIGFLGVFSILSIVLKYLSLILKLEFHNDTHIVESIRKV